MEKIPIIVATIITTNWSPVCIEKPTAEGGRRTEWYEVGVLISNRTAQVVSEGVTQKVLLSSAIHMPPKPLVRPSQGLVWSAYWMTNGMVQFKWQ